MHKILFLRNVWKSKANEWIRENKFDTITELFENYSKCRIWMFQFWHFPPTFVLKMTCLVTLFGFQKLVKIDHFWQNVQVHVARFALNVKWDFSVWFSNTVRQLNIWDCLEFVKVEFEKWCVLSGFDRLKRLDFSDSLLCDLTTKMHLCWAVMMSFRTLELSLSKSQKWK